MKRFLLGVLVVGFILGFAMAAFAYDITFDNNVVKIKKSAITQIYIKDGDIYDPYTSKWRDQGTATFNFVQYSADPNGWKLVTAYRNYHKDPSGEETITDDGTYLNIPFSAWSASGTIQVEPENLSTIKSLLSGILPFYKSGTSYTGWLVKHYFDFWVYKK